MSQRIKFGFLRFQNNKRSLKKTKSKGTEEKGFSLIEVLIGIALIGIGLLSLAQMFYLGVMNNTKSDRLTQATFMAQQQIDFLRGLNAEELNNLAANRIDENIDVNGDGVIDVRRITQIVPAGFSYNVTVLVFSRERKDDDINSLAADPVRYHVRAAINTIISR
jgi:prepilin-type N-terminal cleavage/methylation domain-containing protein